MYKKFKDLISRNKFIVNLIKNNSEFNFKSLKYSIKYDAFFSTKISFEDSRMNNIFSNSRLEKIKITTIKKAIKKVVNFFMLFYVTNNENSPLKISISIILPVSGNMVKLFDFKNNLVYIYFHNKNDYDSYKPKIHQIQVYFNTPILRFDDYNKRIIEKFINYTNKSDLSLCEKKTAFNSFLIDYYKYIDSSSLVIFINISYEYIKIQLEKYPFVRLDINKLKNINFKMPIVNFKWDLGYSNLMVYKTKYIMIDYDEFVDVYMIYPVFIFLNSLSNIETKDMYINFFKDEFRDFLIPIYKSISNDFASLDSIQIISLHFLLLLDYIDIGKLPLDKSNVIDIYKRILMI